LFTVYELEIWKNFQREVGPPRSRMCLEEGYSIRKVENALIFWQKFITQIKVQIKHIALIFIVVLACKRGF